MSVSTLGNKVDEQAETKLAKLQEKQVKLLEVEQQKNQPEAILPGKGNDNKSRKRKDNSTSNNNDDESTRKTKRKKVAA
eukprot:Pgem_evm1s17885